MYLFIRTCCYIISHCFFQYIHKCDIIINQSDGIDTSTIMYFNFYARFFLFYEKICNNNNCFRLLNYNNIQVQVYDIHIILREQ